MAAEEGPEKDWIVSRLGFYLAERFLGTVAKVK